MRSPLLWPRPRVGYAGLPFIARRFQPRQGGILISPDDFIAKWQGVTLTERASSHEHFGDLCRMLGEKTPTEADPTGTRYAFGKRTAKAEGRSTQGPSPMIVCERYPLVPGDVEHGVEITKATVGSGSGSRPAPR